MNEYLDIDTYISISSNKIGIYLFDTKNQKIFSENEIKFKYKNEKIILENLDLFLGKNIFKIEKFTGRFIKSVNLITESKEFNNLLLGLKKKNYEKNLNKNYLENLLTEAKDLIQDSYQDYKIIHILINKLKINEKIYSKFIEGLKCDQLCLEIQFIFIQNKLSLEIENILEKYQIKVNKYIDANYLKTYFKEPEIDIAHLAYRVVSGHNESEVSIVPKNIRKTGFFERFFQLFS